MSLKAKIEAVIYASEEPVTLAQLAGLLGEEAQAELEAEREKQAELDLEQEDAPVAETEPSETPEEAAAHEEAALEEAAGVGDQHEAPEQAEADAEQPLPEPTEATDPPAEDAQDPEVEKKQQRELERSVREYLRMLTDQLIRDYAESDRGIEVREVAGGYRMATKPEYHDAVRGFVKSLRPPLKLSLQALETLAVVAYKQPVTAAEISEIRGVDSGGVLGSLMTRKLIQTAGRKQVVGRPMLYKTTKEFLVRFGLKDINELPSIEEFEKMAGELVEQEDLPMENGDIANVIEAANVRGDAEYLREELAAQKEQVALAEEEASSQNEEEATADLPASEETVPEADADVAPEEEGAIEEPVGEPEASAVEALAADVPAEEIPAESTED